MIPGEYPYGWGVYSLPMLRDLGARNPLILPAVYPAGLARTLVDETPWRRVMLSILMACLSLALLLVLGLSRLEPLQRPELAPVEVAVILQEPVPPPVVAPAPEPLRKKSPAPIKAQPVPVPPPVVRSAPETPTEPLQVRQARPEPRPVAKPQPQEAPLPRPTQVAPRLPEKLAEARPAVPQRKAEVPVQPEAFLLVAPPLAAYNQIPRSKTTADLALQRSTFKTDVPVSDIGILPAAKRANERKPASASLPSSATTTLNNSATVELNTGALVGTKPAVTKIAGRKLAKASLPSTATAAFGSPTAVELDSVDTRVSSVRYEVSRQTSSLPTTARRQTIATGRSQETDIGSPQMSGILPDIDGHATDNVPPVADSTAVSLAGGSADVSLVGPAATVRNMAAPEATALPIVSGSYDFLDSISFSKLDQSVMVSLNRLSTCSDPGEESKLKTRLAALLSQPGLCRSGGVVFDIRNPESAYSIHIDLYNYEQKEFQDRCDALRLAVQSCEARR